MKFEIIKNIIFNNNEKCDVWRYRSLYGTEKKQLVNKLCKDDYIYPLIYTINSKNHATLRYTNNNKLGHFGLSKFIFSNGVGYIVDYNGKYGLTEWAYCIYDNK